MRAGVTVVDPQTTWVDVTVTVAPDAVLAARHAAARGDDRRPPARSSGRTRRCVDTEVGDGRHRSSGRTAWARSSVRRRPSGRSATCARAPGWRRGARSAPSSRRRTSRWARARRCRTCPTSATPPSAGARTSVRRPSSCNYDGVAKHRTTIGDHVRIGSDTMLVAPVTVGDGAYTAAGSRDHQRRPAGCDGRRRGRLSAMWQAGCGADARVPPAAEAAAAAEDAGATAPGIRPRPSRDE